MKNSLLLMLCATVVCGLSACGGSDEGNAVGVGGQANAGGAQAMQMGTATVSEPGACDLAEYPSLEYVACEAQNAAIQLESNSLLLEQGLDVAQATFLDYQQARLEAILADPERQPNPNLATVACPVNPNLTDWTEVGGIVEPVLFTSRAGGTLSGHVWATEEGPEKRPAVLFINGSILACEEVYWFVAQPLARAGFVVMTFDVHGEGMSDQFGASPDELEQAFAGIPVLGLLGPQRGPGGNGLPFYDGGADALNFLLSTPEQPYVPVPSRTSGTSHAAKQQRRVEAGLNQAYNPLWAMLDPESLGISGHSYGAFAASWLGQSDPRIDAVVALDSLCVPVWPSADEVFSLLSAPGVLDTFHPECFGAAEGPAPQLTKPALNLNGDYLLVGIPYLVAPDPRSKSLASYRYSEAGADTGSIVIRGGTHLDFNDEPSGLFPRSLRGQDIIAWYTTAWFAKYLQHDPDADRMLLTARWRDDRIKGELDQGGDANVFSWHYHSRLDVTLADGNRYACENLRLGCPGQFTPEEDCGPEGDYSFLAVRDGDEAAQALNCRN